MNLVSRVLIEVGQDEIARFLEPGVGDKLSAAMAPFSALAQVVGIHPPTTVDLQFVAPAASASDANAWVAAIREVLGLRPGEARPRSAGTPTSPPALRFGGARGPKKLCSVCGWADGTHDPAVPHPS